MPLKEAVSRKRFHHQWLPDVIQVEKNYFSPEIVSVLRSMDIKFQKIFYGEANCIFIDESGSKHLRQIVAGGVSKAY